MFNPANSLYVILDTTVIYKNNLDIFAAADKLAKYGANIFQLRNKDICDKKFLEISCKLKKILGKRKRKFIINDRVDIAYLSDADGLHLGKKDISPNKARKILKKNKLIGKTAHSLKELEQFQKEPIDYLGIGPVFKTEIKPELPPLKEKQLKVMISKTQKAIFAIGGINLYNINSLCKLGIKNIAVSRGILLSKDFKSTVEEFKECLRKAS